MVSRAVDSAWRRSQYRVFGACLDYRRSASGAVGVLAKGAISWLLRIQAVTTPGTLVAGYVALSEAVKEVIFLRQVQDFMEPSMRIGAVDVFGDKEGAIKLAANKRASDRAKHIDVKPDLRRDACDAGKVRVMYVRMEDQHAYLFTRSLDIEKPHKHAKTDLNLV